MAVICVYDWQSEPDYTTLGSAVLIPTSCRTRQTAGGGYTLDMQHPMDPEGRWRFLVPGNIVKVPVPEEEIENAYAGTEMWVYRTAGQTVLRDAPQDPQTISCPDWAPASSSTTYHVGSKVGLTVSPGVRKNYRCVYWDGTSAYMQMPPNQCNWWVEIPTKTPGGAVVATLPADSKLIWISGAYADTWWKMSTFGGIEGWIKQSDLTGEEHREQEDIEATVIKEQLFRIKKVTVENADSVTVSAEHVSYDAAGLMIQNAEIAKMSPAMAIGLIEEALFEPYTAGMICTNLTDTDAGTYTQTIKAKNLIWALMDPSAGVVGTFNAALKRNNWDIYILKKQDIDRGYTIRYGTNAKGIQWNRDHSELVTRIIPVAKDEQGKELYLPEMYVDSPLIDDYPVIRMEVLQVQGQVGKDDGTGTDTTWTEAALYDEMRAKAQERFDNERTDLEKVEVSVDLVMLGDTADYPELKALEQVCMYDIVHAVNSRTGMNVELRVTEIEWDAILERIVGVKLSNEATRPGNSVSGYMLQPGSVGWSTLSRQCMADIVNAAADAAISILG